MTDPLGMDIPVYDPKANPHISRVFATWTYSDGATMYKIRIRNFQINHRPGSTSYYFPNVCEYEARIGIPIQLPDVMTDEFVEVLANLFGE